jgi:hypothetical protein
LVLFRQTTRRDIPELVILLSEFFSVGNPVWTNRSTERLRAVVWKPHSASSSASQFAKSSFVISPWEIQRCWMIDSARQREIQRHETQINIDKCYLRLFQSQRIGIGRHGTTSESSALGTCCSEFENLCDDHRLRRDHYATESQ